MQLAMCLEPKHTLRVAMLFSLLSVFLGQRVWPSTLDLMFVVSCKLAPKFIGPFPVSNVINSVSMKLKLPRSIRYHPTFHVSQLKPVREREQVGRDTDLKKDLRSLL